MTLILKLVPNGESLNQSSKSLKSLMY